MVQIQIAILYMCNTSKLESPETQRPAYCSLTNTAAMPMPEPMHMLVTKIFPPVCFAMFRPVTIWREPAATHNHAVSHPTHTHTTRRKRRTAAQRVPERDRAALQVHLLVRQPELLDRVDRLARERLVDLEEVDVARGQPREREHARDRVRGPHAHDAWRHAHRRGRHVLAQHRQPEPPRVRAPREQHRGRAVRDLRRVSWGAGTSAR